MGSIGTKYQLLPANFSDLDTLAEILVIAHRKDAIVGRLMPDAGHEAEVKFYADSYRSMCEHEKAAKYYKVVDAETGKVVTMIRWHIPSPKADINHWGQVPAGSNEALCDEFFGNLDKAEEKWWDNENYYCLYFLATLPEYQGRGIGKSVLQMLLQEADAAGKKTFLIATPAGYPLYKKLGFEEVDQFVMDARPHGGHGEVTWRIMLRDPRKGN